MSQNQDNKKMKTMDFVYSDTFKSVYSNILNISSSLYDFSFKFGKVSSEPTELKATIEVEVIMSPQHAKAFLKALSENLKAYEKEFGEIKLPDVGGQEKNG